MSFAITNATSLFFSSREEYLAYRTDWKARSKAKLLSADDMARHHLLLGKDLYKAFSPSKRAERNGQGSHPVLAAILRQIAIQGRYLKDERTLNTPVGRLARFVFTQQFDLDAVRNGVATSVTGALQ